MTAWVPAGPERTLTSADRRSTKIAEEAVFSFGHATTGRGPAVHSQELADTRWWQKGGQPTVNEERNRDVLDFWRAAREASVDVGAQLKEAARINREKGLSARGSKLSLSGSREGQGVRPISLYADTISADIIRGAGPPPSGSAPAGGRSGVGLSAAATAAYQQSRDQARWNKKMAVDSNLSLEQELL